MSDKTFEKRKKIIYDFICDDMYVPMKFKEMAMVLQAVSYTHLDVYKRQVYSLYVYFKFHTFDGSRIVIGGDSMVFSSADSITWHHAFRGSWRNSPAFLRQWQGQDSFVSYNPSKDEVIAEIVALLQSPAKNVLSALQS